jgi:hypothetical protein
MGVDLVPRKKKLVITVSEANESTSLRRTKRQKKHHGNVPVERHAPILGILVQAVEWEWFLPAMKALAGRPVPHANKCKEKKYSKDAIPLPLLANHRLT